MWLASATRSRRRVAESQTLLRATEVRNRDRSIQSHDQGVGRFLLLFRVVSFARLSTGDAYASLIVPAGRSRYDPYETCLSLGITSAEITTYSRCLENVSLLPLRALCLARLDGMIMFVDCRDILTLHIGRNMHRLWHCPVLSTSHLCLTIVCPLCQATIRAVAL